MAKLGFCSASPGCHSVFKFLVEAASDKYDSMVFFPKGLTWWCNKIYRGLESAKLFPVEKSEWKEDAICEVDVVITGTDYGESLDLLSAESAARQKKRHFTL